MGLSEQLKRLSRSKRVTVQGVEFLLRKASYGEQLAAQAAATGADDSRRRTFFGMALTVRDPETGSPVWTVDEAGWAAYCELPVDFVGELLAEVEAFLSAPYEPLTDSGKKKTASRRKSARPT